MAAIVLNVLGGTVHAQAPKPNLIFFLSDDQGVDATEGPSFANTLSVHTPNLASFASRGCVFTTTRVNPTCSPTRAMLLSGRSALQTGQMGTVSPEHPIEFRDRLVLQGQERTIPEMLKDLGYYTILIDKWHLGYSETLNQTPELQGFDLVEPVERYRRFDDPDVVGDEHMTLMTNLAISAVQNRPDPNAPYALFFWSIEPHRHNQTDSNGFGWWRVDEALLSSGEPYYHADPRDDTERDRYRAVVEAADNEFARLLRELGVVDAQGGYIDQSDSVVMFMSDNGTPSVVSDDPGRVKGSLYEGGIRVPFVVFGERVPARGAVARLVSGLDLYDTMADIAGVPEHLRGNGPRESMSFADTIGWLHVHLPRREYTLSSAGKSAFLPFEVALANSDYKLIVPAGLGWHDPREALFFDLQADPLERTNLLDGNMSRAQTEAFMLMRDVVADHWPSAVGLPLPIHVDVPLTDVVSIDSQNQLYQGPLPIGHINPGDPSANEARILLRFDVARIRSLLPPHARAGDIERIQLILPFDADILTPEGTDTGPIRIHPMTRNWYSSPPSWNEIANAYRGEVELGVVDVAPHVIVNAPDSISGIPMPSGTPVSFGANTNWLDLVRYWYNHPESNHGVVLIADPLFDLPDPGDDQSVTFLPQAVLRLTVRRR